MNLAEQIEKLRRAGSTEEEIRVALIGDGEDLAEVNRVLGGEQLELPQVEPAGLSPRTKDILVGLAALIAAPIAVEILPFGGLKALAALVLLALGAARLMMAVQLPNDPEARKQAVAKIEQQRRDVQNVRAKLATRQELSQPAQKVVAPIFYGFTGLCMTTWGAPWVAGIGWLLCVVGAVQFIRALRKV